jgi:Spy/CpxP family protein refolding chaperone
MACKHDGPHPFRHHLQKFNMGFIFLMVLTLSGCMHHAGERDHSRYGHDSASYRHGGTADDIHHRYAEEMEKELQLTDDQKEAFNRNKTEYKKMVVVKSADIRAAEIDLADMLASEKYDRRDVQEQVRVIGRMKEDLMMARIDSLQNLKSFLTKDQFDRFQELLEQRMKFMVGNGAHGGFSNGTYSGH